jgi:hypothetical protein
MTRAIACLLAAGLLLIAGSPAWARDAKGKITSYDTTTQIVTFEDGSQYVVTDKVKTVEKIKVGKHVKVTYEEQDGKNMVSDLEEVEAP